MPDRRHRRQHFRDQRLPLIHCWGCEAPLDGGTSLNHESDLHPGAVSFCIYCGAVSVLGEDMVLVKPDRETLESLSENREFFQMYCQMSWARLRVMAEHGEMRVSWTPPE